LIKAAIRDSDPVLYFEHKKLYRLPRLREELPEDDYIVEMVKRGPGAKAATFRSLPSARRF